MPGDSQAFNTIQILWLDYHLRSIRATSDSNSPAMRSWLSITSGPGQGSWHFLRWMWWWWQWLWRSISNWAGFRIPLGNTPLQMPVKTFLEKFSWGGSTSSWAGVLDFMKAKTKGRRPVHLSASCLCCNVTSGFAFLPAGPPCCYGLDSQTIIQRKPVFPSLVALPGTRSQQEEK